MSDDSDSDESVTHLNIAIDFREDPADYPPIFIAARDGDVQALRAELAAGVDPNLRDADSHITPLGVIVSNTTIANQKTKRCPNEAQLMECTRLLLDVGADPCLLDDHIGTTVYHAVCHNHHEILAMLLEAGAGAVVNNRVIDSKWTALAQAARSGYMECLHLLLAAGADVNLRVQNESLNDTPLETAIKWDQYDHHENLKRVFPVLLRAGAAIPPNVAQPYVRKVAAAGGFAAYERAHRLRLATILARVVFPGPRARRGAARPRRARSRAAPRLPLEMVSHVVAFGCHAGDY